MKKIVSILAVVLFIVTVTISGCSVGGNTQSLKQGAWAENTYTRLNSLINNYGVKSKNYDNDCKPYAVFDFDNTTIINDVEEALLVYQIENLAFKLTPDNIEDVLKTGIPDCSLNFSDGYENAAGEAINVNMVVEDITAAYTYIYSNYSGFSGGMTIAEIKATEQYLAFRAKLRFLYDAVNATFDASVGYPWVTYLFTGMTSTEVRALALESDEYWLSYPDLTKLTWTVPTSYAGISGVVATTYKTALRITDEVKDLYTTLANNGIDVYICSASFYDVIVATATCEKYGLNVKEANVYAMMLKKDAQGRYINEFDGDYYQTQGKGKSLTINKFIKPLHGGKDPILVAGDSAGDFDMLNDYDGMVLGLLFNRYRKDATKGIAQQAVADIGKDNSRYVLQGRDENTGKLRPSEKSILLGTAEEVLVRE